MSDVDYLIAQHLKAPWHVETKILRNRMFPRAHAFNTIIVESDDPDGALEDDAPHGGRMMKWVTSFPRVAAMSSCARRGMSLPT
jgi:hypothetical protein